jgi:hypothetical protein
MTDILEATKVAARDFYVMAFNRHEPAGAMANDIR